MVSCGRRKPVGVVEMAHGLGVSTTPVSRALNGNPTVRRELADRTRAHEREFQQLRELVGTRIAGLVISPSWPGRPMR